MTPPTFTNTPPGQHYPGMEGEMFDASGRAAAQTGSREPDPQAVPALSGFDPSRDDAALIEHAVLIARPKYRQRAPRWVAVMDTFALGRTSAISLCDRFDIDPEEVRVRR